MRKIAREVMDERVTKIKIGAQILRTVREVVDNYYYYNAEIDD